MKLTTTKIFIFTLVIITAFSLCSCAASAKDAISNFGNSAGFDYAADEDLKYEAEAPSLSDPMDSVSDGYWDKSESDTDSTVSQGSDLANRKIIKTVNITVETKAYDTFMSTMRSLVDTYGGFVQDSELYDNGNYKGSTRRAYVTVRIPAENLDSFTGGVNEIGTVTYLNERKNDVTLSYVDMESRISSLRIEMEKLTELLSDAKDLEYIIMVQDRLTDVRYELERYESQKRTYDELIAYSTVTLNIHEVQRETVVEELGTWEEIGNNLNTNLNDIGEGFRRLFIDFVSFLPYLAIWVVIIGIIVLIISGIVKKNRKKRLELYRKMNAENNEQK